MVITTISFASFIAIVVFFIHKTTTPGMIFHFVEKRTAHWSDKIKKPLYMCPICMAPWSGLLVVYLCKWFLQFPVLNFFHAYIICIAAGGINAIVISLQPGEKKKSCNCSADDKLSMDDKIKKFTDHERIVSIR